MADSEQNLAESWLTSLRNHPLVAGLIVLAAIVGGLASFTESFSSLRSFLGDSKEIEPVRVEGDSPPPAEPTPKRVYFSTEFSLAEFDMFVANGVTVKTGGMGISTGPFVDIEADADGSGEYEGGRLGEGSSIHLYRAGCDSLQVLIKDIEITWPQGMTEEDMRRMGMAAEALVSRKVTGFITGKCEE